MGKLIHVKVGDRYGRFTIVEEEAREWDASGRSYRRFVCKCDCGTVRSIRLDNLRSGGSKSCGCYHVPRVRIATPVRTPAYIYTYTTWKCMKMRCLNPSHERYYRYGGRGISVCQRWAESFAAFLEDMGERPDGHTIDRKDTDGNYEPGNCRWATQREQQRNRSTTHWLTFDGVTLCVTDWAARVGLTRDALHGRLRMGWTVEDALATPQRRKRK